MWLVETRGSLSRRTEPDAKDGNHPKDLKGADPRNGGRQPEDWFSGTLRGTFLTQAGSGGRRRTCWTSPVACWRSLLGFTCLALLSRVTCWRSWWFWHVVRSVFSTFFVFLVSRATRGTTTRRPRVDVCSELHQHGDSPPSLDKMFLTPSNELVFASVFGGSGTCIIISLAIVSSAVDVLSR